MEPDPRPSPGLAPFVLDPRSEDPADREALAAWLAIQRRYAFQPQEVAARLARDGDPHELCARVGVRPLGAREAERACRSLAARGVVLVPIRSGLYPARLRRLVDAPLVLAVRGLPALLVGRAVAIVGARAATVQGKATAARLAGELARAGVVVVSGLARGIDRAAHEGALEAGGFSIAFQACGPDQVYPAAHRALADRLAARGAVVSELPPGTPPRAPNFPLRNRLISALAEAVVVVEARVRSGSLVTARHAANQGVEVMAVPGAITSPASAGPHQLLRDGATLVESGTDVLAALGLEGAPAEGPAPAHGRSGGLHARIASALAAEPLRRDELETRLEAPRGAFAAALLELELDGTLAVDRDGRLRLLGAPPGRPPG